jgi:hypothetical protein
VTLPLSGDQPGSRPPCTGNCSRASLAELKLDLALRIVPHLGRHLPAHPPSFSLVLDDVTSRWARHLSQTNRPHSWLLFWQKYVGTVEPEHLRFGRLTKTAAEAQLAWLWKEHLDRLWEGGMDDWSVDINPKPSERKGALWA